MEDIKASFQSSRRLGLHTKVSVFRFAHDGNIASPKLSQLPKEKQTNIYPLTLSYIKTCIKEFEFKLARF